jgi:AmiR/NasT family two-component response regulator
VRNRDSRPVLVVSGNPAAADWVTNDLRALGRIAVSSDTCETALEMMRIVDFAVVMVNIEDAADWDRCRRIAAAAACPVAVVTRFLARNRRYRKRAFRAGVAAYICRPCTKTRLYEMLMHLRSGETSIEMVEGAAYCHV